mgnify:CR=1 FL=1
MSYRDYGVSSPVQYSVDGAQRLGHLCLCPDGLAASNIDAVFAVAGCPNQSMFLWLLHVPFEPDFLLFDDSSSAYGLLSPPMAIVSRASNLDQVDNKKALGSCPDLGCCPLQNPTDLENPVASTLPQSRLSIKQRSLFVAIKIVFGLRVTDFPPRRYATITKPPTIPELSVAGKIVGANFVAWAIEKEHLWRMHTGHVLQCRAVGSLGEPKAGMAT